MGLRGGIRTLSPGLGLNFDRPRTSQYRGDTVMKCSQVPFVLVLVLLSGMVLMGGCVRPPDRQPDLRGEITEIGRAAGSDIVKILVEARPGKQDGSDKAYVFVLGDKSVLQRQNDTYKRARTADLETGHQVEIWFDGPVAESYPLQGNAEMVVVVGR